jgi:hypothetical protein
MEMAPAEITAEKTAQEPAGVIHHHLGRLQHDLPGSSGKVRPRMHYNFIQKYRPASPLVEVRAAGSVHCSHSLPCQQGKLAATVCDQDPIRTVDDVVTPTLVDRSQGRRAACECHQISGTLGAPFQSLNFGKRQIALANGESRCCRYASRSLIVFSNCVRASCKAI